VTLAPEAVLERVRGRYISTLHLLDERDYQDGLARLEHDLVGRDQPLSADLFWSITSATRT
jgi:hypothetical protein